MADLGLTFAPCCKHKKNGLGSQFPQCPHRPLVERVSCPRREGLRKSGRNEGESPVGTDPRSYRRQNRHCTEAILHTPRTWCRSHAKKREDTYAILLYTRSLHPPYKRHRTNGKQPGASQPHTHPAGCPQHAQSASTQREAPRGINCPLAYLCQVARTAISGFNIP